MERDLLKKRRPSSRRRAREVRVHRSGEGDLSDRVHVPPSRRVDQRLLREAQTSAVQAHDRRARLLPAIRTAHTKGRGGYGSVHVHEALLKEGWKVSRGRVARLMREHGLFGRRKRRFRHTTDSKHKMPIAPNTLARKFDVDAPNKVWSRTSPTFRRAKDGCILQPSWICSRDASSGGRWARASTGSSPSMRSRRRSAHGGPPRQGGVVRILVPI